MFARNAAPFRASISRFGFGFGRQLCGVLAGLAMLRAAAAADGGRRRPVLAAELDRRGADCVGEC